MWFVLLFILMVACIWIGRLVGEPYERLFLGLGCVVAGILTASLLLEGLLSGAMTSVLKRREVVSVAERPVLFYVFACWWGLVTLGVWVGAWLLWSTSPVQANGHDDPPTTAP